jgi:hypothetical protein
MSKTSFPNGKTRNEESMTLNRKIPKTPKRLKKRNSQREEPMKKRELMFTERIYAYDSGG